MATGIKATTHFEMCPNKVQFYSKYIGIELKNYNI